MLKKLLTFFLFTLVILFGIGIYFYFFPSYPDYGIGEEYFKTRYEQSGGESYTSVSINGLMEQIESGEISDYIGFINAFSYQNNTLGKGYYRYDYMNDPIEYKTLIDFNDILLNELGRLDEQEQYEGFTKIFRNYATYFNRVDVHLVDVIVSYEIGSSMLEYYRQSIHPNISLEMKGEYKTFFMDTSNYLLEGGVENGIKHEYRFISNSIIGTLSQYNTFKSRLFYSQYDTSNILKLQFSKAIQQEDFLKIQKNGRNYIGRMLINISVIGFDNYFEKQENYTTLYGEIITLLSN